ncbi:Asp-tRNA(Asn)/Glu-tRNA(Gln) amidotransferase subunit GatA [bacterium]|nr:Asp-tRNA(Asn)/Glu-tRNA(Gln) amidotransferase subunit GatA [bacterium]
MENLSIVQIRKKLLSKELSATEVVKYYLDQIGKKDKELNAFITVCEEKSLTQAKEFDNNFEVESKKKMSGIPIAVKDVFSTKDVLTTCASHILDGYKPVYDSTVIKRLKEEGMILLGKTNLDQFCHGSSTVTSYYGPTRNPHDLTKLPGGSSGGSSAATAADMCAGSLGTETAGSIRLPASWCGVVGLKPTYGRVPRYGILAMGSSLDSPGPLTKSVEDSAYLLSIMAGYDPHDFTSYKDPVPNYFEDLSMDSVKGMRLAIPKEYLELELTDGVRENFDKSVKILKSLGAEIEEISIMDPKFSMAVYTITCRSEVSSNLARYDGTRFGLEGSRNESVREFFESTRGEGFGEEPKRRVMTGTFSLSAGYADDYFKKSEQVRELIRDDFSKVFKKFDAIVAPSTPSTALTDRDADNPLFGELADILAEGSSEAGLPGISIPNGLENNMPTGIQFISNHLEEQKILDLGYGLEKGVGT